MSISYQTYEPRQPYLSWRSNRIMRFLILSISIPLMFACAGDYPPVDKNRNIDLQGHRGARGDRPENTWAAFKFALENGITTLELDTVMTADQTIIIHHDTVLNPKICQYSGGQELKPAPILATNYAEIKELDCGIPQLDRFPEQNSAEETQLLTLAQFFTLIDQWKKANNNPTLLFNIEIKLDIEPKPDPKLIRKNTEAFIKIVKEANQVRNTTIQSFVHEVLLEAEEIEPDLKRSALIWPSRFEVIKLKVGLTDSVYQNAIDIAKSHKAQIISPYYMYVDREFVHRANEAQLEVIPWTINEVEDITAMYETGVQGVISDYPLRMKKALEIYRN